MNQFVTYLNILSEDELVSVSIQMNDDGTIWKDDILILTIDPYNKIQPMEICDNYSWLERLYSKLEKENFESDEVKTLLPLLYKVNRDFISLYEIRQMLRNAYSIIEKMRKNE